MRKTSKIIIIAMLMLSFFAVPVSAATTSYTLTVTRNGQNQDPKSKRTEKAGGSKWKNSFYVTNENFTGLGAIKVVSINLKNSKIYSNPKYLNHKNEGVHDTEGTAYKTFAIDGEYYYLKAEYSSGIENKLNSTGRYTP